MLSNSDTVTRAAYIVDQWFSNFLAVGPKIIILRLGGLNFLFAFAVRAKFCLLVALDLLFKLQDCSKGPKWPIFKGRREPIKMVSRATFGSGLRTTVNVDQHLSIRRYLSWK